jgi:signal transduction histidine kinase
VTKPSPLAVLYVDDDPRNVRAFTVAFEEEFSILTAKSGAEALELLAREPVAVLVADQRMPAMTGAEVCAVAYERHPDVIRMIVTAYADIGAVLDAVNRGHVSRYVIKPFRDREMADVLRAAIEAFQVSRLAKDLSFRLLQQEQQATSAYFIGRILHEIAQPALALRENLGFVADCLREIGPMAVRGAPELPELAAELHPAIVDAQNCAVELIARIERFRRGEAPDPKTSEGTSLEAAVQAAASLLRAEIRKRARLVLDVSDKPQVAADPVQLSQILVNLLRNACEAIEPGSPETNQITMSTFCKADRCGVAIEDTGGGIAPELHGRLFDPFVSTKDQSFPRGLGLAIVRDIVDRLGGSLEAQTVGRGSRFVVELPRIG